MDEMAGRPRSADVPTYLAWSIFSTLCCCMPIGIVAIVFSCRADTANSIGDSTRAGAHSRMAKKLNIASLVIGLIVLVIVIICYAVLFSQLKQLAEGYKDGSQPFGNF